ncbi:flagellar basal-body MS-ring/collar protein FliF [Chromobacterium violaceum]|uniref:Flagellar M-ring protein n=2 Tax=Chromobacterium violaceum TaxID=536 RepID=A0A1R0MQF3_CHRVL|nr:flagellar basal-body MS-ring/collar protein FliF [Chromobacterium violaceum]ATP29355.1 flagellar M-ring protein FliF [Chromobacterium violaceum]ATP33262.1 flagellar M-ring protein FliF [Chromobacterium violaceum]MBA8736795.1 flagellar M-ring protein FliF [Chromobacterium violaceum]MBP4046071.1 flagellar M-ring protein FliF [Chromobacterium violaceum]MBP4048685.1 flagellar M-ring protein FliF [Chromobacterium violaceum]
MVKQLRSGLAAVQQRMAGRQLLPANAWRYLLPIVLLAIGLSVVATLWLWRDDASYKPVFGAQEKVSGADMMAALDAEKIPYRVHPQTGQVLVPDGDLARARMQLAAKGVVAQLPAGLELLDKNDPLGVSQFVQDVRFRRGLEGELVQSIQALDPVRSARVHLSLPRSTSFVTAGGEKGSASVVVTLKPGQQLSSEQIAAVVKLVAGSVASLDPSQVTLVDQAGNLLSAHVDLSDGGIAGNNSEAARRFRDEALQNARDLLTPALGAGNFKVSVTADVDNDRVEETREKYGEAPKVTNEASREETSTERMALGVPGSLSNRPVNTDSSSPAADKAGNSKNAVTRQYAYDRNITNIKRARGTLRRLSVAVALNQAAAPGGKGWQPAELANIDKLLRNGLGINAERGDVLAVSTLRFAQPTPAEPFWEQPETWFEGARWAAYAVALLLAYLLLARPLLKLARQLAERKLNDYTPDELDVTPDDPLLDNRPLREAASQRQAALSAAPGDSPVVPLLENYDLPPAGSPVDVMVEHLKGLAAKEPERVAEVVKQWVQNNGRKQ